MPRRLNQIGHVLTPGLIIVTCVITALISVSSVVKMFRISVVVQHIIIVVFHKTQHNTKPTATIQILCAVKSLAIPYKGLYKSLIFLQNC